MKNISKWLLVIAATVIVGMIGKAFVLDEGVKTYLMTFFFVGAGLALVRLGINAMMAKMKGKPVIVKIGFFGALLSVGLPFQNWFRTDVLFAMNQSFIVPSVTVMVASVVMMTIVYGIVHKQLQVIREQAVVE